MNSIEEKFINAIQQTVSQVEVDGRIRWLYMVNWIASVLKQENNDIDLLEFYRRIHTIPPVT